MAGYDMHVHTTASDGKLPLEDLVPLAERKRLEGFCVTDHDTVKAAARAGKCSTSKVEIIPGIELGCKVEGKYTIEVLGYFVDPNNPALMHCCEMNKEYRLTRMKDVIWLVNRKLKKEINDCYRKSPPVMWPSEITLDEVIGAAGDEADSLSLDHLNQIFVKRGLSQGREAFKTWLSKDHKKSCYVERNAIDMERGLKAIKSSGGKGSLAHPALVPLDYRDLTDENVIEIMEKFFGYYIQAIEGNYNYCRIRPEAKKALKYKHKYWIEHGKKKGLIIVEGSDGHQKPNGPELGERRTSAKIIEQLRRLKV